MTRRTIVVGDIHGCYDELQDLLERVAFATEDRLISVGDLIAKGRKNQEVLNLFSTDRRFAAVIGNYDRMLLRYWRGESVPLNKAQEDVRTELEEERGRYAAYLDSLPYMIDLGTHLVVHAGVRPGVALNAQKPEDLTELRTLGEDRTSREGTPWYEFYDGEKVLLFGHWPALEPLRTRRAIGLDTGCVYGNSLTAYIIEADEFVSVPTRHAYDVPKQKLK